MTRRTALRVAVCSALLLGSAEAAADPDPAPPLAPSGHLRLLTGTGVLRAPDGRLFTLSQGTHILDDQTWEHLDVELVRLQTVETRLTAENKSMRESTSGWQPGWKTLTAALVIGLAGGWYVHDRLD